LSAYVDEMSSGPPIELAFAAPEGSAAERAQIARQFVEKEDLLALVASFTDGADAEMAVVAEEMEVPLLATLSSNPRSSVAPNRWLRDLCGGVVEQAGALVRCVGAKNVALLYTDAEVASAITRYADGIQAIEAATATAARLRELAFAAVLFAGAGTAMLRLLEEMSAIEWWPPLLFAGAAIPPSLFDRVRPAGGVWIALPTSARDQSPAALSAYLELVTRHRIPTEHRVSQFAALTSLALFLDAARRCDGDLTRQSLLRAVDDTRDFHSGLFPPLTYGAERHIGSTGAWVLAAHRGPALSPVWVDEC
jgi:ABC-type branched-subunit amino acid transport system substrate-binding protein